MTRDTLALIVAAAVGLGAWLWWDDHQTAKRAERRAARAQASTAALAGPPAVREIQTPHGTLVEIRFQVDPMGLGIPESRACYVWRDATAPGPALSCPAEKELILPSE